MEKGKNFEHIKFQWDVTAKRDLLADVLDIHLAKGKPYPVILHVQIRF